MNISKVITTCIVLLAFVSCTDTNGWEEGTRTPSLKASFIYFPQSQIELGGTNNLSRTVQLQAVETPWKITNPASDWLEVSPMEGSGDASVTFKAKENPTSDKVRTALLSLQSMDADYSFSHSLTVNQGRANSVLNLSDQTFELTREAQIKTVSVTANTDWKATSSEDWVHLTKQSDTSLEIKVDENNGSAERTAYITISGSKSSEIKIVQSGVSVTPGQTNVEFTRESQTKTVTVSSNYKWQASCSANWISLKSSPETGKLSITVTENNGTTDRTANISVSNSNTSIKVVQHGYMFEDLISELDFENKSSTKKLSIKTDGAWTATSNKSWIHVSPNSGNSNAQLSVSVDENKGADVRNGTISVTVGMVTKYVSVQQNGAYLDISTNSESEILAVGGTRTVTFSTSDDWTVVCQNPSWVSVDKTSGSAGVNTITLTFLTNTQGTSRTDITYIKSKNTNLQNLKITTIQKGDYVCNGHEYVDLGLPSGTLWATCNVGANSPEEYGDYFAWGETTGYKSGKTYFNWSSYKWCNGSKNTLTKYCNSSEYGKVDNKIQLESTDDAATVNWGSGWCTPSLEQQQELCWYTDCEWTTINGVYGHKITSKTNGNSIFLPITGYFNETGLVYTNIGIYWSSSCCTELHSYGAYELSSGNRGSISAGAGVVPHCYGLPIRPVLLQKANIIPVSSVTINKSSLSMGIGETEILSATVAPINASVKSVTWTSSNTGIAIVDKKGKVTAKSAGTTTITATTDDMSRVSTSCTVTVKATSTTINGHEYVDMGLPSGTLWATCNVGANSPEEYGDYFAWGETTGYKSGKTYFDWSTYKWCNGSEDSMTKYYSTDIYAYTNGRMVLELIDDAARHNWGGAWRMPSYQQYNELKANCDCSFTRQNGVYGCLMKSKKNGKEIFLPAAGYIYGDQFYFKEQGYYWANSIYEEKGADVSYFYNVFNTSGGYQPCLGMPVRPVINYEFE